MPIYPIINKKTKEQKEISLSIEEWENFKKENKEWKNYRKFCKH